ncbi:MAG: hypothetical protein EZS26_001087 [Candidatus Ordinivivax streblomastigis]|uniref:DUF6443 domain-containing protein n=1 Tax=Candidatus Ordinivivax streblomastigis TaxID=2540710 RepID=A0A5M8P2T9_9BACT|nr:MAG: hypothetical protein EZS26_001087 [Candidatus Ordinivivax streblomastigis]
MKMKQIYLLTLLWLCSLPIYPQYPGDIIELSSSSSGGEIKACHSITLKPGFSFSATSGQSLVLKVDPSVCSAYVQENISLPVYRNCIVTVTPLDATDSIGIFANRINVARGTRILTSIQYFDGLGRSIETIQKNVTPYKSDLVSLQEYDSFGRENKTWLPVPFSGNNGNFIDPSTVMTTATNHALYDSDSRPFKEIIYESSPLNNVLKVYGPSQAWKTAEKSAKTNYLTNDNTFELQCAYYKMSGNNLIRNGYYNPGQLYVTKITDEDNNVAYEFKDKLGQVILTRQLNGNTPYDTYFVYDNLGNKCIVLPPLAVDALSGNGTWTESNDVLQKYAYLYRYDYWNRCVASRFPGADWQYFVYDLADRLILSQDGVQRTKNEWSFNKYDQHGRLLISGVYTDTKSHAKLSEEINPILVVEERGVPWGYTWTILPRITFDKALLINYYDDYQHLLSQEVYYQNNLSYENKPGYGIKYVNANNSLLSAKGLLIGSRAQALDGSGNMATIMYYDDNGRIIQQKSTNHLGGIDKEYYAYTFTGQPTKALKEHSVSGQFLVSEQYKYTYDHAGRLLNTILDDMAIESNTYNELGQTANKQQSDVLSTDYAYNIRGWIKRIYESHSGFEQQLFYNEIPAFNHDDAYHPQYNGNICAINWKHNNGIWSSYNYTYDALNRLTSSAALRDGDLTFEGTSYDKNGNITHINRYADPHGWINDLEFSHIGNQMSCSSQEADYHDSDNNYGLPVYYGSNGLENYSQRLFYDKNGRLETDTERGISAIRYNHLNLPDTIQFYNGNAIYYTYAANGLKLRTRHITVKSNLLQPLSIQKGEIRPLTSSETLNILTTDYSGNYVYEDNVLKRSIFPGGYTDFEENTENGACNIEKIHYFYSRDHLGNNRDVVRKDGNGIEIMQRMEYFSFGAPLPPFIGDAAFQPYKYNDKEFDQMHGLNWYDYGARFYDPLASRWLTPDPLAEKYYAISPYAYCGNNPVNRIDPDGKKVIFVNGYLGFGSPSGGATYWGGTNSDFVVGAQSFFNDQATPVFTNIDHGVLSTSSWRQSKGYNYAKENYSSLTGGMDPAKDKFRLISHSMGGAFSDGVMKYLKEQGWDVDVSVYFNAWSPTEIQGSDGTLLVDATGTNDWVQALSHNHGNVSIPGADYTVRKESDAGWQFVHRDLIDHGDVWNTRANSGLTWNQAMPILQNWLQQNPNIKVSYGN